MQVTTRDGALVITMDSTSTTQAGQTPNSTAPFTAEDNHGQDYRSGMLQSWNKFCFTTGYIEVSVTFPGPDQSTQGYVRFLSSGFSTQLLIRCDGSSGQARGQWGTLEGQDMVNRQTGCGHIRAL